MTRRPRKKAPVLGLVATLLLAGCRGPGFRRDIRPILVKRCIRCHGLEATESGLDLRTLSSLLRGGDSGPAVVAGAPGDSLLVELVSEELMPPEGAKLGPREIELLRRWIAAGARESP